MKLIRMWSAGNYEAPHEIYQGRHLQLPTGEFRIWPQWGHKWFAAKNIEWK